MHEKPSPSPSGMQLDRRGLLGLSGALALGGVLGACGNGKAGSAPESLSSPTSKPDKLIIRTWGDPWKSAVRDAVAESFTEQTGIKVTYDLTDFGPMHVKIRQALKSGNPPPVSVVHTVGYYAQRAAAQDLTASLDPDVVTNRSDLLSVGKPPESAKYEYVNVYSYMFPIIYDSKVISPPSSMSWAELLDDRYAGTFFAASTFETLLMPFAEVLDTKVTADADLQEVWAKLGELKGTLSGIGQDSDFISSMNTGQSKWGSFITGNGVRMKESNSSIKWFIPSEGSTLTADSVYVPRGHGDSTTYWAQKFVNHWVAAEHLADFCKTMGVAPTNKKSSTASYMDDDPAFPTTEEKIHEYGLQLPLETAARKQSEWQTNYKRAIQ